MPLCAALLLSGCVTEPPAPPPKPVVAPPAPPAPAPVSRQAQPMEIADGAARCAAFAKADLPGVVLERAEFIADGVARPLNVATRRIEGEALPAHCRVRGQVAAPADAAADAAPPVGFEMRLPSRWSGRFFDQGSSDGHEQVVEAFGRNTGAAGYVDNALARGFAVFASDVGEVASLSSARAALPRAQADLVLARSALTGKALIAAYYGRPPDRSYFVGCSAGGLQGLRFAQRWPSLFDGVVAVAPLLRETDAAIAAAWTLRRFLAVAPRDRKRQRVLSQAFDTEDLFRVAQGILKRCDALDGAEDGFVMDMAACRFDPAELQCSRGQRKDCLPERKVDALRAAMAGPQDAAGRAVYVRWPWDPGIAAPGWRAWTLGQAEAGATPDARHLSASVAALGLDPAELAAGGDAALAAPRLDWARELPRIQVARDADATLATASLDAFRRQRGRLLLLHGAADPVVSAWATIAFQQQLDAATRDAQTPDASGFARTFVVPGMNHCAGGPATDRFDALAAIVGWVERDQPPARIEARGSAVLRDESRPLCPWPQVARYTGSGSLHDSASYACR